MCVEGREGRGGEGRGGEGRRREGRGGEGRGGEEKGGEGKGGEGRGVTLEAQVKVNGSSWTVWRKVALFTHAHDQVHVYTMYMYMDCTNSYTAQNKHAKFRNKYT